MPIDNWDEFWADYAFIRIRGRSRIPDEPRQVILENRIYMGGIRAQDDIYEGHPRFSEPSPTVRADLLKLAKRQMPSASSSEVEDEVDRIMRRLSDEDTRSNAVKEIKLQLDAQIGQSSILSFFRVTTDQRNWSEYGERGKGHAFVFDFRHPWFMQCAVGMEPIDAVPFPIKYIPEGGAPEIPIKFGPTDKEEGWQDIEAALLTKSNRWADQREERLIRHGIGEGLVEFHPQSLKAVVLGYDAPRDDEEMFRELCSQRAGEIQLFRLRADRESWRLHLEPL
ncbi:MAG: hypothetical protein ABIJ73_08550 [Pseudomonadota bacterium]